MVSSGSGVHGGGNNHLEVEGVQCEGFEAIARASVGTSQPSDSRSAN